MEEGDPDLWVISALHNGWTLPALTPQAEQKGHPKADITLKQGKGASNWYKLKDIDFKQISP
jgi:hypothetical protein